MYFSERKNRRQTKRVSKVRSLIKSKNTHRRFIFNDFFPCLQILRAALLSCSLPQSHGTCLFQCKRRISGFISLLVGSLGSLHFCMSSTATYHNKFVYIPLLSSCTRLAWKKYRIFFNTNWLVSKILLCIVFTASCMNHKTSVDGKATLLHSKRSQSKNLIAISIPGSIHI